MMLKDTKKYLCTTVTALLVPRGVAFVARLVMIMMVLLYAGSLDMLEEKQKQLGN